MKNEDIDLGANTDEIDLATLEGIHASRMEVLEQMRDKLSVLDSTALWAPKRTAWLKEIKECALSLELERVNGPPQTHAQILDSCFWAAKTSERRGQIVVDQFAPRKYAFNALYVCSFNLPFTAPVMPTSGLRGQ